MDANEERTLEDINRLADIAGVLHRKGTIQCLSYSESWMKEEYKLLELSNNLLNDLQEGDVLTIRGEEDDDCVLCTKNQTFELKAADTSNSLLVLPDIILPKSKEFSTEQEIKETSVSCCFNTYYECRKARPKLQPLRTYLNQTAFSGYENENDSEKLTTDGLLSLIQASESELYEALTKDLALEIDSKWRILDINYQEKAFSQILALIEEKMWNWTDIPLDETCQVLQELYPSFILEHCLNIYGEKKENGHYSLLEDKVCRYYVEYILRPAAGKFNYNEFMSAWEQSVPERMIVKPDHLKGIALTDVAHQPPVIWHFPEYTLPDDPAKRFNVLFEMRTKWKHDDIEPYLQGLVGPEQKLSALLLKYTRTSTGQGGVKIYNAR